MCLLAVSYNFTHFSNFLKVGVCVLHVLQVYYKDHTFLPRLKGSPGMFLALTGSTVSISCT